jgi:hypothetical protein
VGVGVGVGVALGDVVGDAVGVALGDGVGDAEEALDEVVAMGVLVQPARARRPAPAIAPTTAVGFVVLVTSAA